MIGEISLGGVYVPTLLLLAALALLLTGAVTRLLALVGAYRLVVYRPLVDIALFVLVLAMLVRLSVLLGSPA